MGKSSIEEDAGLPEKLVGRLVSHLKRHLLWDSLLLSFPLFLAFFFLETFLYRSGAVGLLLSASAALLGSALLFGLLRLRAATPSARIAARMIDEKVGGKERFVTLATVHPSVCPPFLFARLRHETAGFMPRLDLKRDFPYRLKRSFFQSLIVSLCAVLLFLLILQIGSIFATRAAPYDELARWAQELSRVPRFSQLAHSLEVLANHLRGQALAGAEKRSLIREALRRVERLLATEQEPGGAANDLLNQAANALRGLEEGLEQRQEHGASGLKDKSSGAEKGSGSGPEQGGKEEGWGGLSGLSGKELTGAEPERGGRQQAGVKQSEMDLAGAEREGKDRDKSREGRGTEKEETDNKGSKNMGEEIPRGKAAERFLKPGEEGEKGIKGARFVTVQLPEEEIASETGQGGSGKRRELRPKTPVGNVPLRRPDAPDASPEKQPLPLEYRGLLR